MNHALGYRILIRWGGFALLFPYFLLAEPLKFTIQGEKALLMNADSGAILFEKEGNTPCYPASTTKVATALYALHLKGEELNMNMPIEAEKESLLSLSQEAKAKSSYKASSYWLEPDGMHMGIKTGEILSLHDLLKGMLIHSANDAANVIAQALGPSIPTFMDGLNAYLQTLGCQQTFFRNPHGLHDPQHVTTAYDLALITKEALQNPLFAEIVAQTRFLRPKTNKQAATALLQTNRLLRPGKFYYPKAIGVKTGYHAKARKTFIGAARSEGRTLILVLLGYPNQSLLFKEAIQLFETAFNQPKVRHFYLKKGTQPFTQTLPDGEPSLTTYLAEDLSLDYYPAEDPEAKCFLYWHSLALPLSQDQIVGEVRLISGKGQILKTVPLLAERSVQRISFFHRLFSFYSSWWASLILGSVGAILIFFFVRKKFSQ